MNSSNIICNPEWLLVSYREALENNGLALVAKWEKFGMLRGYEGTENQKKCAALATYYDEAAMVMLKNDTIMNSGYGLFETVTFPLIRKAFAHDILTPESFGHILNRMYQLVGSHEERLHDVTGFPVHFDMEKHIVDTTMDTIAREFLNPEAYQLYMYER